MNNNSNDIVNPCKTRISVGIRTSWSFFARQHLKPRQRQMPRRHHWPCWLCQGWKIVWFDGKHGWICESWSPLDCVGWFHSYTVNMYWGLNIWNILEYGTEVPKISQIQKSNYISVCSESFHLRYLRCLQYRKGHLFGARAAQASAKRKATGFPWEFHRIPALIIWYNTALGMIGNVLRLMQVYTNTVAVWGADMNLGREPVYWRSSKIVCHRKCGFHHHEK